MASTRFTQQHIIELNEKPASSLLMNKELQNIYKGTNELDDEAKIHRAKQADPTLADTATEKHVTNAQTKKWEDTANTFSGVSPSSFVAATEVVTTATANKILKLNADGKLPTDIVGNATTATNATNATNATTASDSLLLNGKSDTAFQEVSEKDQPGGYAGLDENGKVANAIQADQVGEKLAADVVIKNDLNAPGDAPLYVCRAWVNFDGTTTSPTIRASGNVSSVTKIETGIFKINLIIPMPDINFCVQGTCRHALTEISQSDPAYLRTISSFYVLSYNISGDNTSYSNYNVAVFR